MIKVSVNVDYNTHDILLSRLNYTLEYIQNHPCAPEDILWTVNDPTANIFVGYGQPGKDGTIPIVSFCFASRFIQYPVHKSLKWEGLNVFGFAPTEDNLSGSWGIDVFQTIFFHISRFEEWYAHPQDLDKHGMMSSELQFLVKNSIHDNPVVDHWVYLLYGYLGLKSKKIITQYSLTHDIDAIRRLPTFYKFLRAMANTLFYQKKKTRTFYRLFKTYYGVLTKKISDPYDTFNWLLNTSEEKIKDRKIYFLAGGRTIYENFFDISDSRCPPIYELAQTKKYTIGIHPSYLSGRNEALTRLEKEYLERVLGQKITDSRQHFLRYHIPETGKILENLEIKTDSTFGYRNKTGFRCGTGFPYKMYNFEEERPYHFLEIPMVVMDMAIIHQVGWDAQKFIKHLEAFLEKNRYHTHITFNFHNSTFDPILFDAEKLIAYYKRLFGVEP